MNPLLTTFTQLNNRGEPEVLRIGDIAERMNVVSKVDKELVAFVQAFFETAAERGIQLGRMDPATGKPETATQVLERLVQESKRPGVPLKETTYDAVKSLIQTHHLNVNEIATLAVSYGPGNEPKNSLFLMDVADMLGITSKQRTSPLLATQAGIRMGLSLEALAEKRFKKTLPDVLAPQKEFPPKEGEAPYVRAAQSAEKLTDIFAAAVTAKPQLASYSAIQEGLIALELLSAQSFKLAAQDSKQQGYTDAAFAMESLREGQKRDSNFVSKLASTSTLLKKVDNAMQAIAAEFPEHQQAILQQMRERKPVVQQLNVFGSLVAPDVLFSKKDLSHAERLQTSRMIMPTVSAPLNSR
jgi:hypothetical protein